VRSKEVDEVVKVKSMVTQEIELNEALEAAGIHAWETDLAELIVQLGHDRPSHILVPAIHRNRSEIREIFLREMGTVGRPAPDDLTDDPGRLAEAARLHLREKFLRAKVGVSGANFAVADTGTLVVVESEGNGRMCLTLPETLISVVGIEKVIPSWEDLAPMLQLLPRSSTGERMNPYTTMWTGVHEGDGPQEVHVVLLDNGRSHVLADRVGRQALRCIRCSACLNVCPVYERTGGHAYGSVYPGPIGAVLNPQLRGTASTIDKSLPYASSLCGACFDACPVRINIPELLVELRGQVVDEAGPTAESAAMRAAAWVLSDPKRLAGAQKAATAAGRVVGTRTVRSVPGLGAWTNARDLPTPPTGDLPAVVGPRTGRGRPMSARDEILARVRGATADVVTTPDDRGPRARRRGDLPRRARDPRAVRRERRRLPRAGRAGRPVRRRRRRRRGAARARMPHRRRAERPRPLVAGGREEVARVLSGPRRPRTSPSTTWMPSSRHPPSASPRPAPSSWTTGPTRGDAS
jgi:L-lactate dehydrogenase complex protein LldF